MQHTRQFATPPPSAGTAQVLNIPGLGNSGALHWQSRWEANYPWFERVELGLWDNPDRSIWVERLDRAIRAAGRPVILVAHSLGCLAVGWWAAISGQGYRDPVAGALLVAPADPERDGVGGSISRFGPVPQ